MTIEDKSILNKIKKLMNLTVERGATPEEAANAAAKVQAILIEHNITMSQAESHTLEDKAEKTDKHTQTFDWPKMSFKWRRLLATRIAENYMCDVVWNTYSHNMIHFIGKKSNVEIVDFMQDVIGKQIHRMALDACYKFGKGSATYYRIYAQGAVQTVNERLIAQMKKYEQSCTALMVVNQNELDTVKKQHFPNLKNARRSRISDMMAYLHGRKDGHKVNLTQGIGSANNPSQKKLQ